METNQQSNAKSKYADPKSLVPYERNSRKHSADQIKLIRASIREFGFLKPVLVDENKMILAGHGATQAAIDEGLDRIPIRQIFGLTDQQKRSYVIADNRMSELSTWDWELLAVELGELKSLDADLQPLGFPDFGTDKDKTTNRSEHNMTIGGDRFLLQLEFESEKEMRKIFDEMDGRGIDTKILS